MASSSYIGSDAILGRVMPRLEEAVVESADELLTVIKQDATPELTHTLERGERTGAPSVSSRSVSVKVHAGEGTDYGVIVHQKDAIHHKHGGAHYVTRPLVAHAARHA